MRQLNQDSIDRLDKLPSQPHTTFGLQDSCAGCGCGLARFPGDPDPVGQLFCLTCDAAAKAVG